MARERGNIPTQLASEVRRRWVRGNFMIPDELVEIKQRLRSLEQRLMHRNWLYRLRGRCFKKLVGQIRAVREQTAPGSDLSNALSLDLS
jgi:hypothetical protein